MQLSERPLYVCLHGFTGARSDWDALGSTQDTLALSLLGHEGGSDAQPDFDAEVDRLVSETLKAGPRTRVLVGYSMGARLGLGMLIRHPRLFSRAVLLGVNPGLRTEAERLERKTLEDAWVKLLRERGLADFVAMWERYPSLEVKRSVPRERLEARRKRRLSHTALGLSAAIEVLGLSRMPDYWPELAGIEVPVTLVAGSEDTKFAAMAERAAAVLPKGSFREIRGAGHDVLLEAPHDLVRIVSG